jgi:hypothetical protein
MVTAMTIGDGTIDFAEQRRRRESAERSELRNRGPVAAEPSCVACRRALHFSCWAYLGEVLGHDYDPCSCGCRDESGEVTYDALMEMMRRHPDVVARRMRFDAAFERGSFGIHFRNAK